MIICSFCATEIEDGAKFCEKCGSDLCNASEESSPAYASDNFPDALNTTTPDPQSYVKPKKKWVKRVIISLVVLISIIALFVAENITLYNIGNKYYLKEQYEEATKVYNYVVPLPFELFNEFSNRKKDAILKFGDEKNAAKAFVAIDAESSYADIDKIEKIYVTRGTVLGTMYGLETVLINQTVNGNTCTYFVSKNSISILEEDYPKYYSSQFGVHIHGVGEDNSTRGWLSSGWNVVTNVYSSTIASYGTPVNVENVKKLIRKYEKTKDVKIFD